MQKIRIAINGCGRIGRGLLRSIINEPGIEVIAVNDLASVSDIAYLLKYDTVYGRSPHIVSSEEGENPALSIDGKHIAYLSQKDPALLPWSELDIDIVVESTGFFTSYEKSALHIDAGAKRVVVSAPVKDEPHDVTGATVLMGVNEEALETCQISSNASCTTNAGSPLIAILDEGIGIEKAILNTVHGYTASQSIVDSTHKKNRRLGRAGAENIVPTSTGAAIATTKALTQLEGKFDGVALRVPVPAGSIVDVTFIAKRNTTVSEVNHLLLSASQIDRWKKVFSVTEDELVSSDILGLPYASIADLHMTRVVDGNLVKVLAWYDNEMGYVSALKLHIIEAGKHL